nr:uncharacterized protein LOC109155092 [Ipomoea batatas]
MHFWAGHTDLEFGSKQQTCKQEIRKLKEFYFWLCSFGFNVPLTIGEPLPTLKSSSRPLTRAFAREHNILVPLPNVNMGDMKKLHEEMRDIHATVQKLEDLPASFHTLSDTIAQLTTAVNALVANTPSAPTSTVVTHSDANQATPETVVLSPPDPTPSTRVTRLEFPTFSGKEDPLVWLHRCELFFDKSPVSDHEKVSTAAYYMFDVAQLWFSKRIQDNQQFSWAQFKAACTLRFGPPRSINPLGELANLKQNSRNLEDFIDDFQTLLARADNVFYSQQVDLFTAGLDEVLCIDVERNRPSSLDEAINVARDYARKGQLLRFVRRQFPSPPASGNTITVHQQPQPRPPRIKKLSPTEMLDRQKLGLCYNCDEKWIKGHRCKRQLYMLGIVEEDDHPPDDAFDEFEPEISLHAITGVNHSHMMKIRLLVAGTQITALVDTGSTHNFINATTATRLHLPITGRTGLQVAVANGERLPSLGLCEQVLLQAETFSFLANLFVIPLSGVELVLGIKWLRTLGPIWWDFEALQMSFVWKGQRVALSGISAACLPALHHLHHPVTEASALDALLAKFASIFALPEGLPPSRGCDHRIVLMAGTNPVVVRPYSGGRRSSDHRPHSHPQQPKPDDDAILRVLLRLGGGGGGNEAETPGERHDGDSIGEVRHRGGAANPTKIGANLTKIEEIGNQHRAISKGPSMKGASTGWPHWAVESQASDLVMSIAFFVLFQIGFLQFISLRFELFACC